MRAAVLDRVIKADPTAGAALPRRRKAAAAMTELVAPKFGSERVVYVPGELTELLSEHVRRAGIQPGDWLVSSNGGPLNRNSAGHQWRQLRQAAGLDGYTLHDLDTSTPVASSQRGATW
jgi:integrase